MRKFLSCGLIAAFALLPTAIRVSAEPPPAEPVVSSIEQVQPSADVTSAPAQEQQASKLSASD
jgi:hypothetical protein